MLWVGLTGGIASGKSTVSRMLHEAGAFIIDADALVHATLRKRGDAYAQVVQAFGETILNASGEIDRAILGERVFSNARERKQLEQIVHPHVFRMAHAAKAEIAHQHPNGVIVFDAALLIETGNWQTLDEVIVVYVDRPTQIERLMRRDGFPLDVAERRIDAQMPLHEKRRYASVVIDNMKPREETQKAVTQIYARMKKVADAGEKKV